MIYEMTVLPDSIRVDAICTVLRADYMKNGGIGESHDFPELCYSCKGTHVRILDGKEEAVHEGGLTLIAPGAFHRKKEPTESEGLIISFRSSSESLQGLYNRVIYLDEEERRAFTEVFSIGEKCFCRKPQGARTGGMAVSPEADAYMLESFKKRLELFLIGLCRRYAESASVENRHEARETARICRLLSERISENLSVKEIACLAEISVSALKGLFREKGGVLHTFIRIKIERAKQMMIEGGMNFSEIADALGFASLHYFSRTFKSVTGVSPSQFLRLA